MAQVETPNEPTALAAAMTLVTAMMNDYDAFDQAGQQQEPIDCLALRDMLEAGQKLLVKFCPILRPTAN